MSTRKKTAASEAAATDAAADDTQAGRIVAALTAPRSALRMRGTSVLLDAVLSEPVASFVDVDALITVAREAATGPNTTRMVERHVRPGWERYVARCEANGEKVGDLIPTEARRRISRLLTDHKPPRAAWTKDLVDPKLFRQLLAPVVQQMLLNFAKGLPLPGLGGSPIGSGASAARTSMFGIRDKLKAEVEKRAEKVVEAGRSVLGGLSAEVERQLQTAAKDFSESASREFRVALEERLRSDDGRRLVSQIVSQALDGLWRTTLHDLNKDVDALPWDDIWAVAPLLAEHNRGRDPVEEALRAELQALLAVDGQRTLRELLDEAGLLDVTVRAVLAQADPIAQRMFASHAFRGWLDELLAV